MNEQFPLPETPEIFLTYVGMETDLIFAHGLDLPGFASFPLLETAEGRALLRSYFTDMVALARDSGTGVILESPTWVANRDRGRAIGYSVPRLAALNREAIALMAEVRRGADDVAVVLSANVGPRADAYAPSGQMTAAQAEAYHAEQLAAWRGTEADVVSGYTLAYTAEAVGMVRAAKRAGFRVVIAFTVETNGRLPTGMTLADAIAEVDTQTGGYPAYFMVNCAHPDHFGNALAEQPRVLGLVANASRCSHAELDEATTLDAGDPVELGEQLADLRGLHPQLRVLGGCCGTDMRHMMQIAQAVTR